MQVLRLQAAFKAIWQHAEGEGATYYVVLGLHDQQRLEGRTQYVPTTYLLRTGLTVRNRRNERRTTCLFRSSLTSDKGDASTYMLPTVLEYESSVCIAKVRQKLMKLVSDHISCCSWGERYC